MAAWLIEPITASRAIDGPSDRLDHTREAATNISKAGSPIVISAGTGAAEAGANPATFDGISRLAGKNLAAVDTVDNYPYLRNEKGRRYEANLLEAVSTVTPGVTQVGLAKDGTTGIWVVSTAVANKVAKVVKIDSRVANTGDTYTRVEVEAI